MHAYVSLLACCHVNVKSTQQPELHISDSCQIRHLFEAESTSLTAAGFRVTRKLLKEAQHQVVLLANENRQLNGVRERAVMPAWSSATLGANLVEFNTTQVSISFASTSA